MNPHAPMQSPERERALRHDFLDNLTAVKCMIANARGGHVTFEEMIEDLEDLKSKLERQVARHFPPEAR